MIIDSYCIGNTRIKIDDEYKAKTEEEKKIRLEIFNKIGNDILREYIREIGEKGV